MTRLPRSLQRRIEAVEGRLPPPVRRAQPPLAREPDCAHIAAVLNVLDRIGAIDAVPGLRAVLDRCGKGH